MKNKYDEGDEKWLYVLRGREGTKSKNPRFHK